MSGDRSTLGETREDRRICAMTGVRGGDAGFPVELWIDGQTDRLAIRALNEGGFAGVYIDLIDVVEWLERLVPGAIDGKRIAAVFAAGKHLE